VTTVDSLGIEVAGLRRSSSPLAWPAPGAGTCRHDPAPAPLGRARLGQDGWVTDDIRVPTTRGEFAISTDPGRIDVPAVHAYLTTSYWAEGVDRETVAASVAGSLCFGLYDPAGGQAGFARVITDGATFAYLADVYVAEQHRGLGLGVALVDAVAAHPVLRRVRRVLLATRDAHGLYARHGFSPLARPERFMEITRSSRSAAPSSSVVPPV
jgi:GNAT superfamily N-acetyltransferase